MPIILLLLIFFSGNLYGNSVEVSPIRIDLSHENPIGTLKLTNKSQKTLYLQMEGNEWNQIGGQDQYTPSDNLIVMPLIATLLPGKTQLVRLTLRTMENKADEKAYRLYIKEIPQGDSSGLGIGFNLRIGVPVFVSPDPPTDKKMRYSAVVKDNMLRLNIINDSHYHCRITSVRIKSQKNNRLIGQMIRLLYLLPKQSLSVTFPMGATRETDINVETTSDWGPAQLRIRL